MTVSIYERLIARFCGPASTVDIPTFGRPCRVLRDLGEAVAETALRFSSLVLTPNQVALLNEHPEPRFMYLQGPPGCGKTVVLMLKALQWAWRSVKVVVVGEPENTALAVLMEQQLCRSLGPVAAAGSIQRCSCDLHDVQADVAQLMQLLSAEPNPQSFVLFDEASSVSPEFIKWLTAIQQQLPRVHVWAAGLYRWDNDPRRRPPPWLEVRTMTEPLRCPPSVTKQVGTSGLINGISIPQYSHPVLPLPTEGLPVRRLQHRGQPGHSESQAWDCDTCADEIGRILTRELHVGQPGCPFFKDTWLLCENLSAVQSADVLAKRLRQRHNVPVNVIARPPSAADQRELALAVNDEVIVTDVNNVQGLERAVVIAMGGLYSDNDYRAVSRSTGFLCIIK